MSDAKDVIYVLVALCERIENHPNSWSRAWGWYRSKEEAENEIRAHNNDLIFESGTYRYALIEEVPYGMMGGLDTRKEWWFQADHDGNDHYTITEIPKPAEYDGTICFGMG